MPALTIARFTSVPSTNTLASVHLFGWYGLEKNLEKGAGLLDAVENVLPEDPLMQLLKAKLLIYRTDYPAAFTYAEKAEKGLQTAAETDETAAEDLHRAKTAFPEQHWRDESCRKSPGHRNRLPLHG